MRMQPTTLRTEIAFMYVLVTSKFSTFEIICSRFFLLTFRKKSCHTCGNVRKEEETDEEAEKKSSEEMFRKKEKNLQKKK